MADVQALVSSAASLSSSPEGLAELQSLLESSAATLSSDANATMSALESGALAPDAHALAHTHFLHAVVAASHSSSAPMHDASRVHDDETSRFVALATTLLTRFDRAQVARNDPSKFATVCGALRDIAIARQLPTPAIAPMLAAVRRLRPSPEHLTPQHGMALHLCVAARFHSAAKSLLDDRVLTCDPSETGLKPEEFLLYAYYGGVVLAGLGEHERAAELTLAAATAPATTTSAIAVAAYKKHALCSLIADGEVEPLPQYCPAIVKRHLKAACGEYHALVDACKERSKSGESGAEKIAKAAADGAAAFAAEGDAALAALVVKSSTRRDVKRLTETYLTLSLADVAKHAEIEGGAAAAEALLVDMIASNEVSASVDQKDGVVRFHDAGADRYASAAMAERLDEEMKDMMTLANRVRAAEEAVMEDKHYLQKATDVLAGPAGGLAGMGRMRVDSGGDAEIEDFVDA